MPDIRALADTHRKTDKHNQLAAELGRDPAFDFGASRLLRNVAAESLELQSRVSHMLRIKDRVDWDGLNRTHLTDIISRLEYSLKTAREVLASAEAPAPFLQAAE